MATFRVGQRVKKVAPRRPEDYTAKTRKVGVVPIGAEGTVGMSLPDDDPGSISVLWDNPMYHSEHRTREWLYMPYQLSPLADPDAEKFIESIKKLAREPQNLVIKERA